MGTWHRETCQLKRGEGVRGAFSALRQVVFYGVWQVVLLENGL